MQFFQYYLAYWEYNMDMSNDTDIIIRIRDLKTSFAEHIVHEHLDLDVRKGEILGIVGGSGSGKTTLMREIIMLQKPTAGSITVYEQDVLAASERQQKQLCQRWGVMFQQGALFTSLTVLENVCFPLQEFTQLSAELIKEIALLKLKMANFPLNSAGLYPAELSGGMLKRAALARAIVQDAELLFLDEPTSGLDPETAGAFDELVRRLRDSLELTIVIVTHDLDTLWQITDRVAFLGEKRVLAIDSIENLSKSAHPLLKAYFQRPHQCSTTVNPNIGEE